MRLASLVALVSGGAASLIPAAAVDRLERRLIQSLTPIPLPSFIPFPSPSTCASYITVTETPALLTLTETRYATVTSETVTSTQTSITESTLEATSTATITHFETSFVTETATVATETATQEPVKVQKKIVQQRKKKRDSCKRRSSSSQASALKTSSSVDTISASPTSSSVDIISATSSSANVCTATVTAAALKTTTTLTVTGSATATDVETITSVIVATITTTVSTTASETTAVPTTLSVTATTFVPAATPSAAAPTFALRAVGGSGNYAGQYVKAVGSIDAESTNNIVFTSDAGSAAAFTLQGATSVILALHPEHILSYQPESASYAFVTDQPEGVAWASCQLTGDTTTAGAVGPFTCPNGGSGLVAFAVDHGIDNTLVFVQPDDAVFESVQLEYVILGNSTATTPVVTTPPPPPQRTPGFTLMAVGGSVDGQVIQVQGSVGAASSGLTFISNVADADSFTLRDDGSLVLVSLAADPLNYSGYIADDSDGLQGSTIALETAAAAAAHGDFRVSCQLSGSSTDVGSTGFFTCPNNGSRLHVNSDIAGYLLLASDGTPLEHITVQYTFVS